MILAEWMPGTSLRVGWGWQVTDVGLGSLPTLSFLRFNVPFRPCHCSHKQPLWNSCYVAGTKPGPPTSNKPQSSCLPINKETESQLLTESWCGLNGSHLPDSSHLVVSKHDLKDPMQEGQKVDPGGS